MGGGKSFSHPEEGGGDKRFWGNFNMGALRFNHTGGGRKRFPLFKRGAVTSFTRSWAGGRKNRTRNFSIL